MVRWTAGLVLLVGCSLGGKPSGEPPDSGDTGVGPGDPDGIMPEDTDGDGFPADVDCDDSDPSVHPGAVEQCDGQDNDCDGELDESGTELVPVYADQDGDGYGTGPLLGEGCATPEAQQAAVDGDCDDSDPLLTRAHFVAPDGSHEDVADTLWGDEPGEVTALRWERTGTLRLCPGDWPLALEVAADLHIEGPLPGARLTGDLAQTPLSVLEDGVELTVTGVDLTAGRATHTADSAFAEDLSSGGNLFCGGRSTVRLQDLRVEQGRAEQGGGLFFGGRCEAALERVVLDGNSATELGGAIGAHRAAGLTLSDVDIAHSRAVLGGALALNGGDLSWSGGSVTDNTGEHGAVWVHQSSVALDSLALLRNTGEACGALCVREATVTVQHGIFEQNRAERPTLSPDGEGGGGLFLYNSVATLLDTRLTDNHSGRDGGAVLAGLSTELTLESCTFSGNSAVLGGGAVAVDGAELTSTSSVFSTNTATSGGGLFCAAGTSEATLTGDELTDNTARTGGAVSCDGRWLALDRVVVARNTATTDGGGVFSSASTTEVVASALRENRAADGGGLSLYSTAAGIEDTVFIDNSASLGGGALSLLATTFAELRAVEATGNTATTGGGLWVGQHASAEGAELELGDNAPEDVYSPLTGALEVASGGSLRCDGSGCR